MYIVFIQKTYYLLSKDFVEEYKGELHINVNSRTHKPRKAVYVYFITFILPTVSIPYCWSLTHDGLTIFWMVCKRDVNLVKTIFELWI